MNQFRWMDLKLGQVSTFESGITEGMVDSFCDLSGDVNPLHRDGAFARDRGFQGVVVHGMLLAALYSRLVGVYLPGMNCLLHEIKVTFSSPAYPGDGLRVSGEVTHLNSAHRQMEVRARIERGSELISRAILRVGVYE
jgi:3-hydroxybutyryl-CoA dehydratase